MNATGRDELARMDAAADRGELVDSDTLLDRFTVEEVRGWLTIARALRQWADRGQPYAAIPHALTERLGTPSYPMDHLAPAIDPEGRYCGLDGFYRDDVSRVDWWCLLPYMHGVGMRFDGEPWEVNEAETLHGWDRAVRCQPAPWEPPYARDRAMAAPWVVVRDALIVDGIAAELDDTGGFLMARTWEAAWDHGHPSVTRGYVEGDLPLAVVDDAGPDPTYLRRLR